MDRFAALQAYVRVVESGSFVRAAEKLGWSTSALSRHITDLEQHLGARLLNRTTRRLSLTETGQSFYERSVALLADLAEAEALAGEAAAAARGTLRITTSYGIAVQRVAPAIAAFAKRHPQVKFDLTVSDRIVDLVDEGFDLAVRVGSVGADRLVARRLGEMQLIACAAPAYLARRGVPQKPSDLETHDTLTYAYSPAPYQWRFTDASGAQFPVRVGGSLHANSGEALTAAAVAGLGIVCEPDFLVGAALADGKLVRVLPGFDSARGDIWAVYPSRRHLSLKVRLFVDHLVDVFSQYGASAAAHQ
jgi:DNA-binding transcriptional LysR family regulator